MTEYHNRCLGRLKGKYINVSIGAIRIPKRTLIDQFPEVNSFIPDLCF
jgi:hypothetical protein